MKRNFWCECIAASDDLKYIRSLAVALSYIFFTTPPSSVTAQILNTNSSHLSAFARHYQEGEFLAYTMQATNQDHRKTIHYNARADGQIKYDAAGIFMEEFTWKTLT